MKKLNKKIKQESNKLLKMKRWEVMDKDYAVAWHPLTGLTVDKWEEEIIKYCEDRNRPYFFGKNNWNMPVCIFDHMSESEWEEKMKLEVTKQKKRYFLNPQREVPYGNKLN